MGPFFSFLRSSLQEESEDSCLGPHTSTASHSQANLLRLGSLVLQAICQGYQDLMRQQQGEACNNNSKLVISHTVLTCIHKALSDVQVNKH